VRAGEAGEEEGRKDLPARRLHGFRTSSARELQKEGGTRLDLLSG